MAALNKYVPIPPRLIAPAKAFIEDEAPAKVHEALATNARFDYHRAEFIPREPNR